jgi:hypothetical protein
LTNSSNTDPTTKAGSNDRSNWHNSLYTIMTRRITINMDILPNSLQSLKYLLVPDRNVSIWTQLLVNYNSCGAETTYPSGAPEVTSLSLVGFALFFEILLKVALSTINQIKSFNLLALFSIFFLCHCGPWLHHILIYYLKKKCK